jgi:hypothetical protein
MAVSGENLNYWWGAVHDSYPVGRFKVASFRNTDLTAKWPPRPEEESQGAGMDFESATTNRPEAVQCAVEQWLTSPGRRFFPFGRSSLPIRLKVRVGLPTTFIGEADRPIPVSEYAAPTKWDPYTEGRFSVSKSIQQCERLLPTVAAPLT